MITTATRTGIGAPGGRCPDGVRQAGARELLRRHGERELYIARVTISEFVVEHADETAAAIGFGYETTDVAPTTFGALQSAYEYSQSSGEPLPISSEHSDSVIYADAEVNFAMRFWHDVNHVRRGLTFDLADELELAVWHLNVLEGEGFTRGSVVWQLLHADLIGAAYVMSLARQFPLDQRRFIEGCVTSGFDAGVVAELRQLQRRHGQLGDGDVVV